jgi:hypothetical protein
MNSSIKSLVPRMQKMLMAQDFQCITIILYLSNLRYCNGEPPKGYIDPEGIDWVIPEEITEETPMFFDDGPAPNDVIQGKLGDCWFIGALSVLATRDDLLRGGVGYIEIGPDF